MTKRKIHLPEALQLLANNRLDSSYSIEFSDSDRVEATDAIKLGAIGVDVPEACIRLTKWSPTFIVGDHFSAFMPTSSWFV
ncbi:hypothetical protein [Phaeodactylibacter xiamenensis]|uniref:hypothetical protein n=1 Tax=Phaeodactylibacter xiamenensis TaxID=1524460 RepID=UPI003BABB7E7